MSQRNVDSITGIIIATIAPVLIMFMVASLVFFATHCFYGGGYHLRLRIAAGLFVMAAVLVARISIDDGREYAAWFAVPLAAVTILSMMKYTGAGWLSIPLVAFIWWSTDRLTWDSTVVDFQKDASGEGLLQTIGMDGGGDREKPAGYVDESATTGAKDEKKSLWQRWVSRRRRHHKPGVWVIYFGLAAIPLFGLGQTLLPPTHRGMGFLLLCIYVASALALLMTTSFLQMRRYLDSTSTSVHRSDGGNMARSGRHDHCRFDDALFTATSAEHGVLPCRLLREDLVQISQGVTREFWQRGHKRRRPIRARGVRERKG